MHAIISGAGIAGLTVAGELARAGWRVTVLEKAPAPRGQGYMLDFFGPGFDAAALMGVLPALRDVAHAVSHVDYVTPRGRVTGQIDYQAMIDATGGKLLSLLRPELEEVLRDAVPDSVDVRYGSELLDVSDEGTHVTVRTATGEALEADVLIGADGIHSRVRAAVFGPEQNYIRHLGFHTCAFTCEDPELAAQLGTRFVMSDTIDRVTGLYAVDDRTVAFFGAHYTGQAPLPADPRAAVLDAYPGLGELSDRALAHCPPSDEIYYDLVAQSVLPRWSVGRVALVGDACHAVSLLAGQGASLGVAAGRELAQRLAHSENHVAAFEGFEAAWKPVSLEKQLAGRRSASSFVPRSRFDIVIRRLALRLLTLPFVRSSILNRTIGKSGAVYESTAANT